MNNHLNKGGAIRKDRKKVRQSNYKYQVKRKESLPTASQTLAETPGLFLIPPQQQAGTTSKINRRLNFLTWRWLM